jgi:hypothetical protein
VFTDEDGKDQDPVMIYCQVRNPHGSAQLYTYGTADPSIVWDSKGHYHLDLDADIAGKWVYRWYSTGIGKAANEAWFRVKISEAG